MGYRGDDEALRARARSLETRLREAEAKLQQSERELAGHVAKDKQDESDIASLRGQVGDLRRKLGLSVDETAPDPQRRQKLAIAGAATAVLLLGLMVVVVLVRSPQQPKETAEVVMVSAVVEADKPTPPEPPDPPLPPVPRPVAPSRRPTDIAAFGAVVTEASGDALSVGDGAVLWVELESDHDVGRVRLVGPGGTVYDSTDEPGTSIIVSDSQLRGRAGPAPGTQVHSLVYTDQGMRTGPRARIEVNTRTHRIWVGREISPVFSATLFVDAESAPRFGARTLGEPAFPTVRMRAVPGRTRGAVPRQVEAASAGAPCQLVVSALSRSGFSCRLALRCGGQVIYGEGTSGLNRCAIEDGLPTGAIDSGVTSEDGDPAITFDLAARTITVRDGWSATFALSEDPRCNLAGAWGGRAVSIAVQHGGMVLGLAGAEDGQSATATWRDAEGPMGVERGDAELDCVGARVVLGPTNLTEGDRLAEGSYEGFFGPDYATLMGRYYGDGVVPGVFFLVRGAEAPEVE